MKIVIVGAGVAGLSVGLRLAESGSEVVVLERTRPGHAATWASGGMIAATAEASHDESPVTRFAQHSAALWPEFASRVEARSGQSIAYRQDGSLIAATSSESFAALSVRANARAILLRSEDAIRLEPMLSRDIVGALYARDDAQVDNRALGLALALAFVKAGGVLQINEAVVRLDVSKDRIEGARTPFAFYQADAFVIAAGAWSGDIKGLPAALLPPVIPVKGEMIALMPPEGAVLPTRLIWGDDIYLIPRRDRLLVGATTSREGFDTSLTQAARERLFASAINLMPALKHWPVVEHWAGLRPGSPDDLPIVGETALTGLFIATGQFRNGILFAPAIADALHCLILERRKPPEIDAFDPNRFGAPTFANGVKGD